MVPTPVQPVAVVMAEHAEDWAGTVRVASPYLAGMERSDVPGFDRRDAVMAADQLGQ